jgi:hypothetical protein
MPSAPPATWSFDAIGPADAGLYQLHPGAAAEVASPCPIYFLAAGPVEGLEASYTTEAIWSRPDLQGWYVVAGSAITEPGRFAAAARTSAAFALPESATANLRGLAFLGDPGHWTPSGTDQPSTTVLQPFGSAPLRRTPEADLAIDWGAGIGVRIPAAIRCTLLPDADGPGLRFASDTTGNLPSFELEPLPAFPPPAAAEWTTDLVFAGPQAGGFATTFAVDPGTVYELFGGGLRYGWHDEDRPRRLDFPWFPWVPRRTGPGQAIQVHCFANPLAPYDQDRTRLVLDLTGTGVYAANARALVAPHLQRRDGLAVTLVPDATAAPPPPPPSPRGGPPHSFDPAACGFAFARGPGTDITDPLAALAPVGRYCAEFPDGQAAVMPGLSGLEYLEIASPFTVLLRTGQPAEAASFGSAASPPLDPPPLLAPRYVTSGCQVLTGPDGPFDGYYAQPDASVFYDLSGGDFHTAVAAQVSTLPPTATFPIAPLLGVFPSTDVGPNPGPNLGVTAESLRRFIEQVVTPARYHSIVNHVPPGVADAEPTERLPRLVTTGSTRAASGSAMTPQGLLVDLDDNGNWVKVHLAQGPVDPTQELSFADPGGAPLSTRLVGTLLRSQLVWVVSELELLEGFTGSLDIGDFVFAPSETQQGASQPLLIFKYSTSMTLAQIADSPGTWADSEYWAPDTHTIQQTLRDALATAATTIGQLVDPFASFRTLAADPNWTGIIAVNTAIDPRTMPPDLQMLFAGLDAPLTAHHFGIEANQIATGSPVITKSSLFGVIHYIRPAPDTPDEVDRAVTAADEPSPFAFEVCELSVVIANSIVTDFQSSVALRVDELFGRSVQLQSPAPPGPDQAKVDVSPCAGAPNTIRLTGSYERHGSVGTVTFGTRTPYHYVVDTNGGLLTRVLQDIWVTGATLTPVAAEKSRDPLVSPSTTIESRLELAGSLGFAANPFPSEPLDLFGYGVGATGLDFCGLAFTISFELGPDGTRSPTTIAFDATGLIPTATPESMRPGALVSGLPLKLTGFKAAAGGLTAAQLGAQAVHLPQAPTSAIASPTYALVYDLPLGSLGSLAEAGATLSASLVVGWGPVPAVPGNDGLAVLVQLPQATAGVAGFSLQGILKVVFGTANLMRLPYPTPTSPTSVWVVTFSNVALSLLGITFPPGVIATFVLFSDPAQPTGSNMAWYLAVSRATEVTA